MRDAGVFHSLPGIGSLQSLNSHPKSGASWEGFLLEAIVDRLRLPDEGIHFRATHTGAELDLLIARGRRRIGIEVKRTTAPRVTRSIRSSLADLDLSEVVVHAGRESCRLAGKVRAVAASRLDRDLGLRRTAAGDSYRTPSTRSR